MIVEYDEDKQVKILFKDFFALHFENQLFGSILFDIAEGDIDLFVS